MRDLIINCYCKNLLCLGLALGCFVITVSATAEDEIRNESDVHNKDDVQNTDAIQNKGAVQNKSETKVIPLELHTVEVVGVTPSSSLGLPLYKLPGNIQSSCRQTTASMISGEYPAMPTTARTA